MLQILPRPCPGIARHVLVQWATECVCVCVCARLCASVRVRGCVCVRVCVCVCVCVPHSCRYSLFRSSGSHVQRPASHDLRQRLSSVHSWLGFFQQQVAVYWFARHRQQTLIRTCRMQQWKSVHEQMTSYHTCICSMRR